MTLPKDPQKAEQYREKMSMIVKARCTPEYRDKLSRIATSKGFGKCNKGKHHCVETRLKMSIARKGKTLSEQTRLKMSQSHKGQPLSEEHKLKISKALEGHTLSEETKLKIAQTHQAKWEGIVTKYDLRPYQGGSWESVKWRKEVFEKDNYTCQDCLKRGVELNAHHIFPWVTNELLRYILWNGITLCVKCHKKIKIHRRVHSKSILSPA